MKLIDFANGIAKYDIFWGWVQNFQDVIDINIRTLKAHINNKFHPRLNFRRKKEELRPKKNYVRRKIVPRAESYRKYIMIMIN